MGKQSDRLTQMLRPHGGYRSLRSFQTAEIIFDATIAFCDRFVNPRSRTVDQMVQSARNGRISLRAAGRRRLPARRKFAW